MDDRGQMDTPLPKDPDGNVPVVQVTEPVSEGTPSEVPI